ncbi:MAG: hypothetical protein QXP81_10880 [Nitrososphaerota archaeon]
MKLSPDPADVERAVRSLRLVLQLVNQDPLARGARAMLEAWQGVDIGAELERWLRNPTQKVRLRDQFIEAMVKIWKDRT